MFILDSIYVRVYIYVCIYFLVFVTKEKSNIIYVFLTVYCRCIFLAKAQVYTEQCTLHSKVYVCLLSDKLYNIVYPPVIQQILYIIYNTQPLLQYTYRSAVFSHK